MVETVTARATHYDALGVKPSASSDEIARAFSREMGRPRAFGGLADVSIAYEVLRNPERRRAYDEAIGITKKPEPEPETFRRPMALHARPQFIASPPPRPKAKAESIADEPKVEPARIEVAPVEKPNEPSLPPFFANALREIAKPEPLRPLKAEPSAPIPRVVIEPMFAEDGPAPWKKLAVPAGAAILAVALIGAYAGWQSKSDPTTAAEKTQAALLTPPPLTTYSVDDPVEKAAKAPVLDESSTLALPVAAKRTTHVATRITRAKQPARLAAVEQQLTPPGMGDAAQTAATEQTAELPPDKPVSASMPLPNSVIARTISRIGYPCGSVVSTSQILGGAYTVTCTSGHVYRAAPVHGRYHFRRVKG